eukprot:gene2577-13413_t
MAVFEKHLPKFEKRIKSDKGKLKKFDDDLKQLDSNGRTKAPNRQEMSRNLVELYNLGFGDDVISYEPEMGRCFSWKCNHCTFAHNPEE